MSWAGPGDALYMQASLVRSCLTDSPLPCARFQVARDLIKLYDECAEGNYSRLEGLREALQQQNSSRSSQPAQVNELLKNLIFWISV